MINKPLVGLCCKQDDWIGFLEALDPAVFRHVELTVNQVGKDTAIYQPVLQQEIRRLCRARNISLSLHALGSINLAEKVERIRHTGVEILADTLLAASNMGSLWVTVHPGSMGCRGDNLIRRRQRLSYCAQAIRDAYALAGDPGILVGIENQQRFSPEQDKYKLCAEPDDFSFLFSQLDGIPAGVILDLGHASIYTQDFDCFGAFYQNNAQRILGTHLHLNNGKEDTHEPLDRYVPVLMAHMDVLTKLAQAEIPLLFENYSLEEMASSYNTLCQALETKKI